MADGSPANADAGPAPGRTPPPDSADGPVPRRRGLAVAWVVLAVMVIAVGSFAVTRTEFLDVDEVRLVGLSTSLDQASVLEATSIQVGSPMVGIDLDEAVRRVAALPRVAGVEVERDWPGTVVVWIVERRAVVNAVAVDGQVAVLDADGTVLEHLDDADPLLPTIRVDDVGHPGTRLSGLGSLLDAAQAVTPDLAAWIVALVPTGDGVRAELAGGAEADLGLGDDYRDEMRALATVLHRVELSCIVRIDVSVHDIPVVRRDDMHCS